MKTFLCLTLIFGFLVGTTQPSFAQQSASKPSALSQEEIAQAQKVLNQFLDIWLIQKNPGKMKEMLHPGAFSKPEIFDENYQLAIILPENRKDQDQFRNESIEFLISLANLAKGTNIKDRLAARFVQRMGLKKGDQIAGSEGVVLNEPLDDNYVISTGLETPPHLHAFLEGEGSPEEINKLLKSSVYCSLRLWLYFEDNSSGDATLGITLCKHNKEWKILDVLVAEN